MVADEALGRYWHFLGLQLTFDVALDEPLALVTMSVTDPLPRAGYETTYEAPSAGDCAVPLPVSDHANDVGFPVDVLVKVQTKPLHDLLMLATGPGGGGGGLPPPVAKCV